VVGRQAAVADLLDVSIFLANAVNAKSAKIIITIFALLAFFAV
jgi:hypothetical protein